MVSKYTEKNKFDNYTWKIKLDNLFHIYILGTDNSSFLVEFKEWKWISYKTHFTYVTNNNLEITIKEIFEKAFIFFENQKKYIWTEDQKNQKLKIVLQEFQNLGEINNSENVNKKTVNYNSSSLTERNFKIEDFTVGDFENSQNNFEEDEYFGNKKSLSDKALDEAAYFLNQGNLALAIDSLERFTEVNGDNLQVLIMLARFKILTKSQFEVKILAIKILGIMQQNIGYIPKMEMEEFDIIMKEIQKM